MHSDNNHEKQNIMATTMINRFRLSNELSTGVVVKTTQITSELFRTVAYSAELEAIEVRECGRGTTEYSEFSTLAKVQHNGMCEKYSNAGKFDMVYESFDLGRKIAYTRRELKGRGISLLRSNGGVNAYTVTELALSKLKGQMLVKFGVELEQLN